MLENITTDLTNWLTKYISLYKVELIGLGLIIGTLWYIWSNTNKLEEAMK